MLGKSRIHLNEPFPEDQTKETAHGWTLVMASGTCSKQASQGGHMIVMTCSRETWELQTC